MTWSYKLLGIGLLAPLATFGCKDEGSADGGGSTSSSTADDDGDDDGGPADSSGGGPTDCVPGTLGCSCLDGLCADPLFCIESECVLGPSINIDNPREVLAGLAVPLEVELEADTFMWTQVAGPTVELLGAETTTVVVNLPPDLTPGDEIVLQVDASRNGVSDARQTSITVRTPEFEDFLPEITDPTQLGTSEGLAFSGNDTMWVVSTEGFASVFNADGGFIERHDVPGQPVGANIRDDNLIIANAGNQAVEQLNMVSGNVSTVFDAVTGGGVLGTVNHPVIDQGGNIYVSNREGGQVFRYDMEEGTVSVFLEGLLNPNALAFGPEGSNVLYVGTLGTVWRVSVEAGGVAGTPVPYLELGPDVDITYEVDGITFDEGQNMWVGCPNAETLYVARYVGTEATTAIREWSMTGAGYSYFVNTTMGRGDFGGSLYWTNLSGSTVGRLRVGLGRL